MYSRYSLLARTIDSSSTSHAETSDLSSTSHAETGELCITVDVEAIVLAREDDRAVVHECHVEALRMLYLQGSNKKLKEVKFRNIQEHFWGGETTLFKKNFRNSKILTRSFQNNKDGRHLIWRGMYINDTL